MTGIKVPALIETITLSGVVLGEEIGDYRIQPNDPKVYREAPTLAELRHAYFDKNPDGSFISPEYRNSVLSKRGDGEWTSTFLRDGKEAIERPENISYDNKKGLWLAEGGKVAKLELPPEGWILEYDRPTGFPSRTSKNRKDAEKVFGDDTSYFWYTPSGLRAVLRGFGLGGGPFYVDASYGPDDGGSGVGVRPSSRLEQDAKHLATPVVPSNTLEQIEQKYREMGELIERLKAGQ